MTGKLDAKVLWWHDAEPCPAPDEHLGFDCDHDTEAGWENLFVVPIGTTPFITDRFIAFPAHMLDNAPTDLPVRDHAAQYLNEYLADDARPHPSERLFNPDLLDLIETAGYRVRPLRIFANAHGICDPDGWRVVGVVLPIDESATDVPGRAAIL